MIQHPEYAVKHLTELLNDENSDWISLANVIREINIGIRAFRSDQASIEIYIPLLEQAKKAMPDFMQKDISWRIKNIKKYAESPLAA